MYVQISRRFTLKGLLTSQLARFLRVRLCDRFNRLVSIHVSLRAFIMTETGLLGVLPSRFRVHEICSHFLREDEFGRVLNTDERFKRFVELIRIYTSHLSNGG